MEGTMFDAFLKIEGIEGESADDKHKNEIEILSFSWGVVQPRSGAASTAGSLSAERAQFHDLIVTKSIDKASPKLALGCASGEHFKSARLELCRAGGDKEPYMEYKLTDVMITSVSPGGSRAEETIPVEQVSMAYGKVELKYTQTKVEGGRASGNVVSGWDLKANKKV